MRTPIYANKGPIAFKGAVSNNVTQQMKQTTVRNPALPVVFQPLICYMWSETLLDQPLICLLYVVRDPPLSVAFHPSQLAPHQMVLTTWRSPFNACARNNPMYVRYMKCHFMESTLCGLQIQIAPVGLNKPDHQ